MMVAVTDPPRAPGLAAARRRRHTELDELYTHAAELARTIRAGKGGIDTRGELSRTLDRIAELEGER